MSWNANFAEAFRAASLLLAYVTASCLGLYLLKSSVSLASIPFAVGGGLYALGAVLWITILRWYPLSVAFPIAAGSLMIGTTLVGRLALKEPFGLRHMLGMLAIIVGISLLSAGGRSQ
jgi:multidrug transporter EmrE-like cation transporter